MIDDANKYYNELNGKKVICVDFDNTICLDEWPYIGPIFYDAIKVLKELKQHGHKVILFTQRSYKYPICCKELKDLSELHKCTDNTVDILSNAIKICNENEIIFDDVNENSLWEFYTYDYSRKIFADYYIDDHNVGMKYNIIINSFGEKCKTCDWKFIDKWLVSEGLYNKCVLN